MSANPKAAHIAATTRPIASAPITAIVPRFRRRPSRMIPSLSTLRTANRMPGTAQSGAPPSVITVRPSSMASGTSKPTASAYGKNCRATRCATSPAAAASSRPGNTLAA